jgi:hypothetical protein
VAAVEQDARERRPPRAGSHNQEAHAVPAPGAG